MAPSKGSPALSHCFYEFRTFQLLQVGTVSCSPRQGGGNAAPHLGGKGPCSRSSCQPSCLAFLQQVDKLLAAGDHLQTARYQPASIHLFFLTLGAYSRADFPRGLADLGTRIAWLRNKVLVYIKYTHKIKIYQCLQIACSLSVGSSGVDVFNKHKYAEMLVRPFSPLILVSWCLQHVNRKEEQGFSSSSFLPLLNLKHQNLFSFTLLTRAGGSPDSTETPARQGYHMFN